MVVFRMFFTKLRRMVTQNLSQIISVVFSSFKNLPVRVSLAIIGSVLLTLTFLVGLFWGFLSANAYNEDLRFALQNSITPLILLVIFWISLTTFLPSIERRRPINQTPDKELIDVTK